MSRGRNVSVLGVAWQYSSSAHLQLYDSAHHIHLSLGQPPQVLGCEQISVGFQHDKRCQNLCGKDRCDIVRSRKSRQFRRSKDNVSCWNGRGSMSRELLGAGVSWWRGRWKTVNLYWRRFTSSRSSFRCFGSGRNNRTSMRDFQIDLKLVSDVGRRSYSSLLGRSWLNGRNRKRGRCRCRSSGFHGDGCRFPFTGLASLRAWWWRQFFNHLHPLLVPCVSATSADLPCRPPLLDLLHLDVFPFDLSFLLDDPERWRDS